MPKVFSPEEINQLRSFVAETRYRVAFELLVRPGLRVEELLRLRVGDVDVARRRIRVSGEWERDVSISGAFVFFLRTELKNRLSGEYLIPGKKGKSIGQKTITRFLSNTGKRLGLKNVSARNLRTTAIVRRIGAGDAQAEVLRQFGIQDHEKTWRRYRDLAGSELKRGAGQGEKNRLDF